MFGKSIDNKRFWSLQRVMESSAKAVGIIVLRRKKPTPEQEPAVLYQEPEPRLIEPPLLPTEILRLIFELLWYNAAPKSDVQSFRQACHLFNEIALEYIYESVTVPLNEGDDDALSIDNLIERNKPGLSHVSRLDITGLPPGPDRFGRLPFRQQPTPKYSPKSRQISHNAVNDLLKALEPNQLISFTITGRQIPLRVDVLSPSILLGKQSSLRQLCMPITLLFRHGINTAEVLAGIEIPRFESLVITDLQYPRHIADVWTLLQNSGRTLKSLAIKSSSDSELERFLEHRAFLRKTAGLAFTELSCPRLQDLHLECIPYLDKFFEDCAPNLVDFTKLRMLRLEKCPRVDVFLLLMCNIYRMPNLRSLLLFEAGTTAAIEGILPSLGPMGLETFALRMHHWESEPRWGLIKEHLSSSLKRLWIEHAFSYRGPHNVLDMTNRTLQYKDTFFPCGWPKLEEVTLDTQLLDGKSIMLPETVKVCRIIGSRAEGTLSRHHPIGSHINGATDFRCEPGKQLNVEIVGLGTTDRLDSRKTFHRAFYYSMTHEQDKAGQRVSSPRFVLIDEARRIAPDSHIMWFERGDKPWSDKDGSFWR